MFLTNNATERVGLENSDGFERTDEAIGLCRLIHVEASKIDGSGKESARIRGEGGIAPTPQDSGSNFCKPLQILQLDSPASTKVTILWRKEYKKPLTQAKSATQPS